MNGEYGDGGRIEHGSVSGTIGALREAFADLLAQEFDWTTGHLATLLGPVAVAAFAIAMNWILTRPELTELPLVHHTLPRRDPVRLVATSSALGTVFYLLVVAAYTGQVSILP